MCSYIYKIIKTHLSMNFHFEFALCGAAYCFFYVHTLKKNVPLGNNQAPWRLLEIHSDAYIHKLDI